jgi:hypothetical protein
VRAFLEWILGEPKGSLPSDSELGFRLNQAPEPWVVFLFALAAILFVLWIYRRDGRDSASSRFRFGLGAIRVALIALALLLLTEPVLLATRIETKPSTVAVLLDDSFSMKFGFPHAEKSLQESVKAALGPNYQVTLTSPDGATRKLSIEKLDAKQFGQVTRMQVACQALRKGAPGFFEELRKRHTVKFYTFHQLLAPGQSDQGPDLDLKKDVEPRAPDTRIGDCLRQALRELRGLPLAGVVLITDGRQNAGEDPVQVVLSQLKAQRTPLFTVSVGDPGEPKDIELTVDGPDVILPDDPAEVFAYVRQVGGYDKTLGELRVEMRGMDGATIGSETIKLGKPGEKVGAPLKFRVSKPGKYSYALSVPEQEGEARPENNLASYNFQVVDKKVKVLYVEGQDLPRWEYRYLKNALLRDHTTEADILLATAENTFIWEGSPGKNPLDAFPINEKEIGEYDVLILGDVSPAIFTTEQLKLIQKFVREGSGFIMIAGARFAPSSYSTGPLAELLPVVPQAAAYEVPAEGLQEPFPIELTPTGKQLAWTHLDPDELANKELWESQPRPWHQYWYYPVKRAKELASIIAVHPFDKDEQGKKMPLIAIMPYGQGRSLFLAVDELWRWRYGVGDRYHYRFYNQAIRYLSMAKHKGAQKRFLLGADKAAYAIGDKVLLDAHLKDANFKPLKDDHITVFLQTPTKEMQTLELKRAADREGAYEGHFYPNQQGEYSLWLKDKEQPEARQAELAFKVDIPQLEMENPRMNEELLRLLASSGGPGGKYVGIDRLAEVPPLIQPKEENIPREVPITLWDKWLVLVLFGALITAEWVLRKRGRML